MSKKISAKFSAVVAALAIVITGLTAMPANATASTAKQPAKTVTIGSDFDENGNGKVVVVGGWVYSLQGFNSTSFWGTPSEASSIKRTKVSTFGTGIPVTIIGQSDDDASREVSNVGGSVTKLWRPVSMDVVGNSIFVLDHSYEDNTAKRLIHIDLTGTTDSSANLTGTVIATTDSGLDSGLTGYGNVKTLAAASETVLYTSNSSEVFKITKAGSTWSSDSGTSIGSTIWGLKMANNGELVVAQTDGYYGGAWTFKFFNTSDLTTATATATLAADQNNSLERREYDFAVDPANNDILFVQKNGSVIQRIVRTGNTYGAAQFEAMGGADQYSATALNASSPAMVGGNFFYDATITEPTGNISIGSKLSFGDHTCAANSPSCYFNANGDAEVTAVAGNKVTFKLNGNLSGSGYTGVKLQIVTNLGTISGLTVDNSANGLGLLALDRGGDYSAQFPARLVTFKVRSAPLGVSSVSIRAGHKSASASFKQPGFIKDISSVSAHLFEGATSAAALSAATARTSVPAASCSWNPDGSGNGGIHSGGYNECSIITGLTPGKFYALGMKTTTIDGTDVWNLSTTAAAVLDAALTITLPTEPDPADSNVGPGYAHQGATSTAASELISSGYKRFKASDGKGGNYMAFLLGADFKSTIKVVHILNTGTVDTAFGVNGVLEMANQSTGYSGEYQRSPKLGWYGEGEFVYLDRDNQNNLFNLSFAIGNDVEAWTFTEAEAESVCAAAFPGALANATSFNEVSPVSAPTGVVFLEISCSASYGANQNDWDNRKTFEGVPVYATATANGTLELVASSISGVTNYAEASAYTNRCVDSYSSRNSILPGSGDLLFTALISEYAPSGSYCQEMSANKTVTSLKVYADGTTTRATTGLSASNYPSVEGSWTTSSGKTYVEIAQSSDRKLYRLTADGVVDTSFGTAGARVISAPACAGTYRTAVGISENQAGDVYFNALSWANQMGGSPTGSPVFPFAVLLEKASGNTADLGTKYLGATLTFGSSPNISNAGYWTEVGSALLTTTISGAGDSYIAYYAGAAGMKSIKIDSFTSALPAGDDRIECPPSPFEAVAAIPTMSTDGNATVQMTNGSIFAYNVNTWGNDVGKATIFTPGANPKNGSFEVTESSNDIHANGWAVALPGNKVLVGGGQNENMQATRSVEIYDPAAAAGSKWTRLTGTAGATDLLVNKTRRGAVAQLLANGKVLVFGGYDMSAYNDGELITIGGANASSAVVAFADAGGPFSNIIPAGAGKWLLFGTSDRIMAPSVAAAATEIYTESTGALTAGPALSAGRVSPAVVNLGGTKTLIAGDNTMVMGPNAPVGGRNSYDIYDSANNTITSKTLTSTMSNSAFSVGFGALLPSGKVLLIQTQMTMNPAMSKVLNVSAGTMADGELMINGLRNTKLFNIGDKVLLAGGRNAMGGGMSVAPWQVFSEPAVVAGALTIDARKVLKGTTGSMTITSGVPLVIGAGTTALNVQYSNGTGGVLKASPSALITGATKLKIDKTGYQVTVALPTVAQINASAVGTVIATLKQGSTSLGTVTINYVTAKDAPVFATQVPPTIPGAVASFPLGVTTNAGNGVPALGYKSGTTKVCTVAANGTVTRVARGLCKITVSQAADLGTLAKSQEYSFTFAKSTAALVFAGSTPAAGNIDLTEEDVQLSIGATVDTVAAPELDLVYTVDNDDKCSIDDEGVLNTLAVGNCLVTVAFAGNSNIAGPVSITRQYTIVTPSQENPGTVGGVIGDAIYEAKDDPADTMLTVAMTAPKNVKRVFKLGRGFKIAYAPTLKKGSTTLVTGANFQPTMTSSYIGSMTTTFIVARTAFTKTPSGWKVSGTNVTCTMTYGSKTQVAASKKTKTVTQKPSKAGCALPALNATVQVKVKNSWNRLGQKKGSVLLTPQKRTAKINLQ